MWSSKLCMTGAFQSYLVECIKLGSRAQSLGVLAKQDLGRGSRVDNDNGNISKLDLVNCSVYLCPLSIFLSCIHADLANVSYQWDSRRPFHPRNACLSTHKLIYNDIGNWNEDD